MLRAHSLIEVFVVARRALHLGQAILTIHLEEIIGAVFYIIDAGDLVVEQIATKTLMAAG
jgi:hypothetical protein